MLDLVLLRIMKHKNEYDKLYRSIPEKAVDAKTQALLDDFGKYFKKFPDHEVIDLEVFTPRFKQWHPTMTEEQYNVFKGILRNVSEDVSDGTRQGVLGDLYELGFGTQLANAIAKYDEGDLEIPLADIVSAHLDAYKINRGTRQVEWNEQTIEELAKEDADFAGIRWRLNCLNECMRPLRGGDFGIIAGRPDKGKTSFIASEIPFMAPQMQEDRNVVWLNNEGLASRIKKRLYQSALGMDWTHILELMRAGKPVMAAYDKVVGRRDRIRIIDIHGMHIGQVEAILEQSKPGIVVFDMIDRIKGFGSEARTDLMLEEMYAWARERCVKYDFIGLATSQISNEGENEQFPGLSMLKDSKTGKQGACDFQLMIGTCKENPYSRYLSLPKNKLRRDDAPGDPKAEVIFKPTMARYEDLHVSE